MNNDEKIEILQEYYMREDSDEDAFAIARNSYENLAKDMSDEEIDDIKEELNKRNKKRKVKLKQAKKCKDCEKIIRSHNKSGYCRTCYFRIYSKKHYGIEVKK